MRSRPTIAISRSAAVMVGLAIYCHGTISLAQQSAPQAPLPQQSAQGLDFFKFLSEIFPINAPPTEPGEVPGSAKFKAEPNPNPPTVAAETAVPNFTWQQFQNAISAVLSNTATVDVAAPPESKPQPKEAVRNTVEPPEQEPAISAPPTRPQVEALHQTVSEDTVDGVSSQEGANGIGDLLRAFTTIFQSEDQSEPLPAKSTVANANAASRRQPSPAPQVAPAPAAAANLTDTAERSIFEPVRGFFSGLVGTTPPIPQAPLAPAPTAPPPMTTPDAQAKTASPVLRGPKLDGPVLPLLIVEAPRVAPTEVANLPREGAIPPSKSSTVSQPLKGVGLKMSRTGQLGGPAVPAVEINSNCFKKGPKGSWFCFDLSDWPKDIARHIEVDTWLYRNGRRVVQYDKGNATRIFTLFPSRNFEKISAYFSDKFGPPTVRAVERLALIGAPAIANPSHRWQSEMPDGQGMIVLEIRKFDDERRMVTDRRMGFIRLYKVGTTPVFRFLNETDLMLQGIKSKSNSAKNNPS